MGTGDDDGVDEHAAVGDDLFASLHGGLDGGEDCLAARGQCLRMNGAKDFIQKSLRLPITKIVENPDGSVFFFQDHEGVTWHIKDYLARDKFVNW